MGMPSPLMITLPKMPLCELMRLSVSSTTDRSLMLACDGGAHLGESCFITLEGPVGRVPFEMPKGPWATCLKMIVLVV